MRDAPPRAPASLAELRAEIRPFLDEDPAGDDNLLDFGLTSIEGMTLVTRWREAGLAVNFADIARATTLDAIWARLAALGAGERVDG